MSSLTPRPPYSQDELEKLYPAGLKLQLVQVLLRHGERTPVSTRFRNTGLPAYWPYCNAARRISSMVLGDADLSTWTTLQWERRMETFSPSLSDASSSSSSSDADPAPALGPAGEARGICQLGELTDAGRASTLALGKRLRRLYVEQLGFMPPSIADAERAGLYLRSTPMPRALESVQQAFCGMYPPQARAAAASFPPPSFVTRTFQEETLIPSRSTCRRFGQLSAAFAQRAADRWNASPEMEHVNRMVGKWMPEDSPRVAVDSHPRLSGVMDTVNATLAHGRATRLPDAFYDATSRAHMERIAVEESFAGYAESEEYRRVGIGALVGELVSRMVGSAEQEKKRKHREQQQERPKEGSSGSGSSGGGVRFALSGCHDTTLAAVLTSLGAYAGESWPPFTSHIALELFRTDGGGDGKANKGASGGDDDGDASIGRRTLAELSARQAESLEGYYVRVRYNDRPMSIPGCKAPGKHLEGDESLCTLKAFKAIADKFTPRNWRKACEANLDKPAFPAQIEEAGY